MAVVIPYFSSSHIAYWLFQSIKSPVISDFSFLVGLNAQSYL